MMTLYNQYKSQFYNNVIFPSVGLHVYIPRRRRRRRRWLHHIAGATATYIYGRENIIAKTNGSK